MPRVIVQRWKIHDVFLAGNKAARLQKKVRYGGREIRFEKQVSSLLGMTLNDTNG